MLQKYINKKKKKKVKRTDKRRSICFLAGEIIHRSRFLRSDTYKANMEANRIVVSEMGTMAYPDPSKNFIFK